MCVCVWRGVKLSNNINANEDKLLGHHFVLQMNGYHFEVSVLQNSDFEIIFPSSSSLKVYFHIKIQYVCNP